MEVKQQELIKLIDKAVDIAQQMEKTQKSNTHHLNQLVTVLRTIKNDALKGSLEPSKGIVTLGLSRQVADWIEPLDSPLLTIVGEIEKYYQKHLN
ncbi:conserved hypothetical protein [Rippkaea orientalis PCC 8801]|uniref:Tsi6 domain-containing protein n=1 Tax=Rippkaea orientalis (strain PCC 8801 / RF-1) TaxID=41431 RepID=B7K4S3_RIPO1|nr:hypothetical protein [Rippkaea orientalis]ACK66579.1 conserved hypothetical protein [Rippkaea orientalis PCC 8801]